jgi:predicted dehydrogenase
MTNLTDNPPADPPAALPPEPKNGQVAAAPGTSTSDDDPVPGGPIGVVVVGAGKWAHECWVPLLTETRANYHVRAVVDPRLGAAEALSATLGLGADAAFEDLDSAVRSTTGLTAGIVLAGPDQHATTICALAGHGLHVLTEKPLAVTAGEATTIEMVARRAGVRVAVVQNYRHETRIQRFRQLLHSGALGPLSYLVARFAADYRRPGSWDVGDAHDMPDPLLVEGSIHHLDMIRHLTGAEIRTVAAVTGDPAWSSFAGPAAAGVLVGLSDGSFAVYEGNLLAAGEQRRWHREYYRAECRDGAVELDGDQIRIHRGTSVPEIITVPADDARHGHQTVLAEFARWLHGGDPASTCLADNLRSVAAVFAARDAAATARLTAMLPQPTTRLEFATDLG